MAEVVVRQQAILRINRFGRSRSAKRPARRVWGPSTRRRLHGMQVESCTAEANAISPPKPTKARPVVGARVKVLTENEDKEGLYYDDDRVAWQVLGLGQSGQHGFATLPRLARRA